MLPDRVSNPGPLTYESGALPIALRGPAFLRVSRSSKQTSANTRACLYDLQVSQGIYFPYFQQRYINSYITFFFN